MSMQRLRILIVGGYGVFGGRLARLLADEPRCMIMIAGRSEDKARSFVATCQGTAEFLAARFDRDGELIAQIEHLAPDLIVDASGPFQDYQGDPYKLVRASIAHGCSYLDLADASAFVEGITTFDEAATKGGVFVLSGVSSFPVLTAAVVRALTQDMTTVETLTAGIAPSPYSGVGENVIRAIASYAGQPISVLRDGGLATAYGLTETRRETVAPPGHLPLNSTLYSLVDVPDYRLLPKEFPGLTSMWIGAGPVPFIFHIGLVALARIARWLPVRSLSALVPLFVWTINTLRWGEHRGGMFVRVEGRDAADVPRVRSWHLIAEGDDGPLIPSMAAEAIVRKVLDGDVPQAGARSGMGAVDLADYQRSFDRRAIYTGIRDEEPRALHEPLYQRVLGDAWHNLPVEMQAMHSVDRERVAEGVADIDRGTSILSRLVGWVIGFPAAGRDVPLRVRFTQRDGIETWQRTFGQKSFSSLQWAGTGRASHLINEGFGPFTIGLAAVASANKVALIVRSWTFLGMPLPRWLAPSGEIFETVTDGRFRFHVEIKAPLIGLLVCYRGWLITSPADP